MREHARLYAIKDYIERAVKELSDEDLAFSYWLDVDSSQGSFENAVVSEYFRRGLNRAQRPPGILKEKTL